MELKFGYLFGGNRKVAERLGETYQICQTIFFTLCVFFTCFCRIATAYETPVPAGSATTANEDLLFGS